MEQATENGRPVHLIGRSTWKEKVFLTLDLSECREFQKRSNIKLAFDMVGVNLTRRPACLCNF